MKIILLNMGLCDSCEKPIPLPQPPNKDEIDELYNNEDALCKIIKELKSNLGKFGTGFFCEIKDKEIPFERALFTNNHVLDETDIENNKEIEIEYLNEKKYIKMTRDRRKFTNKSLDYTCIEIFKDDDIAKFFKIDNIDINSKKSQDIFILQYPGGGQLKYSLGRMILSKNDIIKHNASTLGGSSGSPLIKRYAINHILGLHHGTNQEVNLATPFHIIFKDIKHKLKIHQKINLIYDINYDDTMNYFFNNNRMNEDNNDDRMSDDNNDDSMSDDSDDNSISDYSYGNILSDFYKINNKWKRK